LDVKSFVAAMPLLETKPRELQFLRELPFLPIPQKKQTTMGEDGPGRRDMCVGTSVAVNTDPDHLGPCEPGTSVTLEGIVWHETEGGVLVVNVTWRGKTYVGTLLDCTRHDWAPPSDGPGGGGDGSIGGGVGSLRSGSSSTGQVRPHNNNHRR